MAQNESHQIDLLSHKREECISLQLLDWATTLAAHNYSQEETTCPRFWDGIACWDPTPANTTAWISCPDYVHNFDTSGYASRFCTSNGTWFTRLVNGTRMPFANYSQCRMASEPMGLWPTIGERELLFMEAVPHLRLMSICGYSLSMIFLVTAIVILLSIKRLYCPRNTLHVNLFLSFILRAIATLVTSSNFMENGDLESAMQNQYYLSANSVACRLLYAFFNYAIMANYFWIFLEGLYLSIMVTFKVVSDQTRVWLYILAGWLVPFIFVGSWSASRFTFYDELCWSMHQKVPGILWILRGPITAMIICNMLFFIDIFVVIFMHFRNQTSLREQQATRLKYRKLAKATLVLLAVFGIHFFFLLIFHYSVENSGSIHLELAWLIIDCFFTAFQGLFASILFCFANGEVRNEIQRYMFRQRMNWNNLKRGSSKQSYTSTRMVRVTTDGSLCAGPSRGVSRENSTHLKALNGNGKAGQNGKIRTTLPLPSVRYNPHSSESLYINTVDHSLENSDDELEIISKVIPRD